MDIRLRQSQGDWLLALAVFLGCPAEFRVTCVSCDRAELLDKSLLAVHLEGPNSLS